jgi:hypothetical protein
MEYWQARMQLESSDRRSLLLARLPQRALIELWESEAPGELYRNDLPICGESITNFGSAVGQIPSTLVHGNLRALPVELGWASEPDGSITLAHTTPDTTDKRSRFEGTIGDGDHGNGGPNPTGDFDFFEITGTAGRVIEIIVRTPLPLGDLNPIVALYDSSGTLLKWNDEILQQGFLTTYDSYMTYSLPADGSYYVAVGGFTQSGTEMMFPTDPFDPASGPGPGSQGSYQVSIGLDTLDPGDNDFFMVDLRAGDVIGATVLGAVEVSLHTLDNQKLVAAHAGDLSGIYPSASPLPGGGHATFARVVDTTGAYAVGVGQPLAYCDGSYQLDIQVYRPTLDLQAQPVRQILFLDFDGATIDRAIFGLPPGQMAILSPLSAFLSGWGLQVSDTDAVINAVVATVIENLSQDVRARGRNGDFLTSGRHGEFVIEVRNSRDHSDPFGQPHVSRVIIGGTIEQLGLTTIAIAEAIDVGNFATAETAVVLLDLLSAAADNPNSLNSLLRAPGVSMIDLVGVAVGNIAAHEAGHLFANYHTERDQGPSTIMDRGGDLANIIGAGEDEVFGTADDVDVDLNPDTYSPAEIFSGVQNSLDAVSFDLPAGGMRPDIVARPLVVDFGAIAVAATASRQLAVSNQGSMTLDVQAVLTGPDAGDFQMLVPTGFSLAAGEVMSAAVTFAPQTSGIKSAAVVLDSNDPRLATLTIPLQGGGGVPDIAVSPAAHDYGELTYGDVGISVAHSFMVSNSGNGDLLVSALAFTGANPEQMEVDSGDAPFLVGAGDSRQVIVSYRPRGAVGPAAAILRMIHNDPFAGWVDVQLGGFAWGADIIVSPGSHYHFGLVEVGKSKHRIFEVTNSGVVDLLVSSVALSGENRDDFSIESPGAPFTVVPGETLSTLQVFCRPTSTGEKIATLTLTSSDPDQTLVEIELQAEGVVPEIKVEPEALDFGEVQVQSPVDRTLKITNTGGATLFFYEARLTGPDATEMEISRLPLGIAGGGTFDLRVTFTPSSAGFKRASLEITSNDPVCPLLEIPLTAVATQQPLPIPVLAPGSIGVMIVLLVGLGATLINRRYRSD